MCACMPVLGPICCQSRRRKPSAQAAIGHGAYARFPRSRERERQWNHELQTITSSSEVDVESSAHIKPNEAHDIRKTIHVNVTYHNALEKNQVR